MKMIANCRLPIADWRSMRGYLEPKATAIVSGNRQSAIGNWQLEMTMGCE